MNVVSFLETVNKEVMKNYPDARFFEVNGVLPSADPQAVSEDIDEEVTAAVYQTYSEQGGIVITAKITGGEVVLSTVEGYKTEDRPMSPYVPCDAKEALERIYQADILYKAPMSGAFTLRFALHPDINEPHYYFTDADGTHFAVGVYSASIDYTK